MTTDIERDTDAATMRAYQLGMYALTIVTVGAFALSFHGLNDLGMRVSRLPWWMAWILPIIIDFFALVGIFTGHAMRHGRARRRAYAWLVTLLATGLSVAGNVADAGAKHLGPIGIGIFAIAPPVIFLSSHLIVVCRREIEDRRTRTQEKTERPPKEKRQAEPLDAKTYAVRQARAGWTTSRIHDALVERGDNVSERTVARWTKDVRVEAELKAMTEVPA